jgi:hypothetical protein
MVNGAFAPVVNKQLKQLFLHRYAQKQNNLGYHLLALNLLNNI